VPPYFAKRLSFPEAVTPWNAAALAAAVCTFAFVRPRCCACALPEQTAIEQVVRQTVQQLAPSALQCWLQVRAGPDALPGAVAVEDEQGRMLSLATLAPEVSVSLHQLLRLAG
jgi:hypothetical protein